VAKPVVHTVVDYLEETGSTEAVDRVEVRARVKGFIEAIHFEPGQEVNGPEQDNRTLEERFAAIDTNKDQKLTPEEFTAGKTENAKRVATFRFRQLDLNRDEFVSPAEFERWQRTHEERFAELDADGSGDLTLQEYLAGKKGDAKTKAEAQFKKKDRDGDGRLDLNQFKPDKLFTIEKALYLAKVHQARASASLANSKYTNAESQYRRRLALGDSASQADLDRDRANRDIAYAELRGALAQLDEAELNLGYTDVTAPIDGRVGKALVKMGNLVTDAESSHLATVIQYDPIYANFNVSERAFLDFLRTRKDRPEGRDKKEAKMFLRRSGDDKFLFEGHFNYAELAVDQSTGTYPIRGIFPNPDLGIFPGLFVRVRVPVRELKDAKLIPQRAILGDTASRYVLVIAGSPGGETPVEVKRVDVNAGLIVGTMQVVTGKTNKLKGDEYVIIDGVQRARPGAGVLAKEIKLEPPPSEVVKQGANVPPDGGEGESTQPMGGASSPGPNAATPGNMGG